MFFNHEQRADVSLLHDIIEDDVARNMIIQLDGNEQASMFALMGVERIGLIGETESEKDADLKQKLLKAKHIIDFNKLTPVIDNLYKQMLPTENDFIPDMLLTAGKSDTPAGLRSITKQAVIYCIALAERNHRGENVDNRAFENYLQSAYRIENVQAQKMSEIMERIFLITSNALALEKPANHL